MATTISSCDPSSDEPPGGAFYWLYELGISLSKYRRIWIACSLLSVVLGVWVVPSLPLRYKSEAVIQIRKSLATATNEDLGLKPTEAAGQISEDYRVVQTGILEGGLLHDAIGRQLVSRELLEEDSGLRSRLRELLLAFISSGAEESLLDQSLLDAQRARDASEFVTSGLSVRRGHKSPKIEISFTDDTPDRSQTVLKLLLDEYRVGLTELYDIAPLLAVGNTEFERATVLWSTAQSRFEGFCNAEGVHDPRSQIASVRKSLEATENEITKTRVEFKAAESRAHALNEARADIPELFRTAPTRTENRYRWMVLDLLASARAKLLESPFADQAPEYAALRDPVNALLEELKDVPEHFTEENPAAPNSSYFKLMSDLALAKANVAASQSSLEILDQRETALRQELQRLEEHVPVFRQLERQCSNALNELEDKEKHVLKIRRIEELGAANLLWSFKVLQAPSLPIAAFGPGRALQFAGFCAVGILISIGAAIVFGLLDRSVRGARELERSFGVLPIAAFPDLSGKREVSRLLGRMGHGISRLFYARKFARSFSDARDFSTLGPHSIVMESRIDALIRTIRGATEDTEETRVLTVSGVHAGAGSTTIAINLARRLAEREGGVLIAVSKDGELDHERMLASEGVDVFFYSGTLLSEEQARAGGLREWAQGLGTRYQTIVVDAPPVLGSSDALRMLSGSDISLLVARGDVTTHSALTEAATAIDNTDAGQVGVVLNAYHEHLPTFLSCA